MNKFNISVIAVALGVAFSTGSMAEGISKTEYQAGEDKITAEYKSAKAACDSFSGNKNDICIEEAKGTEKVRKAELEASYKPSRETRYDVSVAKAEAAYAVAKERCDDMSGNAKDVCVKEAKAAEITAKADAKAQMKTSDANATAIKATSEANATADEKSAAARSKASEQASDARKDATADKRDAEYKVATEKCDAFAGGTKDECLINAKAQFGK